MYQISTIEPLTITTILIRLLLAMVFGSIVGLERGVRGRAAGFRTHMLVCIGSALVMITNQYIVLNSPFPTDMGRLGAQVISGIGFLGAGTIIVTSRNQVKGLTTAAGLWASACLGLAIGVGFYEAAIIAGILILIIISVLQKIDHKLIAYSRHMEIYVEFSENGRLSGLMSLAQQKQINVRSIELTDSKFGNFRAFAAVVTLQLPHRSLRQSIIEDMLKLDGLQYLEEI